MIEDEYDSEQCGWLCCDIDVDSICIIFLLISSFLPLRLPLLLFIHSPAPIFARSHLHSLLLFENSSSQPVTASDGRLLIVRFIVALYEKEKKPFD